MRKVYFVKTARMGLLIKPTGIVRKYLYLRRMKMKKILLVLMVSNFCLSCASLMYTSDEGYKLKYEIEKSGNIQTITITGYSGRSKTVKIPEAINNIPVTVIGPEAFYKKGLESVTIPSSISVIGYQAFAKNKLTSVVIPSSVRVIGKSAFMTNKLTSVVISYGVITIRWAAFFDNKITSISIPESVTTIEGNAFRLNNLDPNDVEFPARFASESISIFGSISGSGEAYHDAKEIKKKKNEANEMYALANKRRDEGNISAAIILYRGVLATLPDNIDAKNNLKVLWDRRIEQNQQLYPPPFAGVWKYVIKKAGNEYVQVVDDFATARLGGTQYKMEYRWLPEENILITFNSRNYTIKSTNGKSFSGTFYYHNSSIDMGNKTFFDIKKGVTYIELEDEGFMLFDGNKIYFGDDPYERVKQ